MRTFVIVFWSLFLLAGAHADNLSIDGFQSTTLTNGIPVHFKANANNQVLALQASLRGGSGLLTPETAGWEALALTMLTRGSAKYSYAQLKDLQWRTSSSLAANASSFDASTFGLVALPGSFDALFEAWSDALLHPRWDQGEFDRVLQDAKISLQQSQQDPYNRAVTELNRAKFVGHPYGADFSPTAASLAAVTLPELRAWWESNLKSGRLTLFAVGNFDFADLTAKLNATLGTLPAGSGASIPIEKWLPVAQAQLVPFPDAGAVGYVRADFAIPAVGSADNDALNLGFTILNDILFDIVRAKYGACYSVWARSYGFLAPYGSLVVYKSDSPGKVKAYLDEAIDLLASGKALASQASASAAGKGGIGGAAEPRKSEYVDLEQVLAFYQAKSVNGFYEGQQTNGAIAGQMSSSVLYRGHPQAFLDYATRIRAVKAADVVRVIRDFVQQAPKAWVVLAAPALLDGVTPESFADDAL